MSLSSSGSSNNSTSLPTLVAPTPQTLKTSNTLTTSSPSRDISHLLDKPSKNVKVPQTKIPTQYHVVEVSATAPSTPSQQTFFSEKDKMWHTTVFPSLKPTSRQEVLLLDKWLNDMLAENVAKVQDPVEAVKEAQQLYSMCFHEIIRQVYVHCAERGQLMEKVWYRYLQLFEHILRLREAERSRYQRRLEEQKQVYQQLYREKDGQFNKVYLSLAAEKEQETMTKDKLERAVLLLHNAQKRRAKREMRLKHALQKLRADYFKIQNTFSSPSIQLSQSQHSSGVLQLSDEEEEEDDEDLDVDVTSFSEANIVLSKQMTYIRDTLKGIHSAISGKKREDNTATLQNLDEVIGAISNALYNIDIANGNINNTTPNTNNNNNNNDNQKALSDSFKSADMSATLATKLSKMGAEKPKTKKGTTENKGIQVTIEEDQPQFSVPSGFGKLFSKSLKVPSTRIMDRAWVFSCIDHVYAQKLLTINERGGTEFFVCGKGVCRANDKMPAFLHAVFSQLYGTRQWAENHLLDFLVSLKRYHSENIRLLTFMRFTEIVEDGELASYTVDDLNFYLHLLSMFTLYNEESVDNDMTYSEEEEGGVRVISVSNAITVLNTVFSGSSEENIRTSLGDMINAEANGHVVDFDWFLDALTSSYHTLCRTLSKHLIEVLTEHTAIALENVNGNEGGILTCDEFSSAMNAFSAGLNPRLLMTLYSEILLSTQSPLVTIENVVQIAREHGLLRWSIGTKESKPTSGLDVNELASVRLRDFLKITWILTENEISDKIKGLQGGLVLVPKIYQHLKERMNSFLHFLGENDSNGMLLSYRVLMEQLYFATNKQNRIVLGED
eukprot:TRINITY_DN4547_c0_g1_i1.p1 TRINITY_DN4547_c0_g1~~TRINITY_DN4547_c0_g1_i1.p1  ORF type:complete len:838 (+),score=208.06 TRINITY_DN4547_c0_g1_i1:368-2881(+)